MKIKKFTTENPRKREKIKYSILEITQKEFDGICKALYIAGEVDEEAANMLKVFGGMAKIPDIHFNNEKIAEMRKRLEELKAERGLFHESH